MGELTADQIVDEILKQRKEIATLASTLAALREVCVSQRESIEKLTKRVTQLEISRHEKNSCGVF